MSPQRQGERRPEPGKLREHDEGEQAWPQGGGARPARPEPARVDAGTPDEAIHAAAQIPATDREGNCRAARLDQGRGEE